MENAKSSCQNIENIAWLDAGRVFAMFAVVLLHVSARNVAEFKVGSVPWWVGNIYDSSTRWSVPVFVMISGALLLRESYNETYRSFYVKRFRKLLAPLVFWSITYIVINQKINDKEFSFIVAIKDILTGSPYYHLWFIYMILCLYAVTPLIKKMIKNLDNRDMILLIIVSFVLACSTNAFKFVFGDSRTPFITTFLSYVPYFLCGKIIYSNRIEINKYKLNLVFIFLVILCSIGTYITSVKYGQSKGLYFYDYLSLTTVPTSICIMLLIKQVKIENVHILKQAAMTSLGIYLIHPIFLIILGKYYLYQNSYIYFIVLPAIAIAIAFISMVVTKLILFFPYLRRVV